MQEQPENMEYIHGMVLHQSFAHNTVFLILPAFIFKYKNIMSEQNEEKSNLPQSVQYVPEPPKSAPARLQGNGLRGNDFDSPKILTTMSIGGKEYKFDPTNPKILLSGCAICFCFLLILGCFSLYLFKWPFNWSRQQDIRYIQFTIGHFHTKHAVSEIAVEVSCDKNSFLEVKSIENKDGGYASFPVPIDAACKAYKIRPTQCQGLITEFTTTIDDPLNKGFIVDCEQQMDVKDQIPRKQNPVTHPDVLGMAETVNQRQEKQISEAEQRESQLVNEEKVRRRLIDINEDKHSSNESSVTSYMTMTICNIIWAISTVILGFALSLFFLFI